VILIRLYLKGNWFTKRQRTAQYAAAHLVGEPWAIKMMCKVGDHLISGMLPWTSAVFKAKGVTAGFLQQKATLAPAMKMYGFSLDAWKMKENYLILSQFQPWTRRAQVMRSGEHTIDFSFSPVTAGLLLWIKFLAKIQGCVPDLQFVLTSNGLVSIDQSRGYMEANSDKPSYISSDAAFTKHELSVEGIHETSRWQRRSMLLAATYLHLGQLNISDCDSAVMALRLACLLKCEHSCAPTTLPYTLQQALMSDTNPASSSILDEFRNLHGSAANMEDGPITSPRTEATISACPCAPKPFVARVVGYLQQQCPTAIVDVDVDGAPSGNDSEPPHIYVERVELEAALRSPQSDATARVMSACRPSPKHAMHDNACSVQ
jgi:hypothetical protein